ncbi:hypothetical protein SAMN05660477_03103 [Soonwooa buanensis]|uniref:Transposase n=1 Tax=Soonwooa buanensis TaxID=619805 RepID=A0A1T5GSN5_9FLAO|nr:hypothetical protein [Soonwooa buanensis]SKC11406.1 hypothetical protein SAMN05660477_03103 [Soonwooa buanensis]
MKKALHFIYRKVKHKSNPVTDVATKRQEIAIVTEIFGFVINTTYKAL